MTKLMIMDCQQAQRLYDDHVEQRLDEQTTAQWQRHLAECSDCRVACQRAARLLQLLAVKRHEKPSPVYLTGFLDEFHQRLDAEEQTPGWWRRFLSVPALDLSPTLRFAMAAAIMAAVVGVSWQGLHPTPNTGDAHLVNHNDPSVPLVVAAASTAPAKTLTSDVTGPSDPSPRSISTGPTLAPVAHGGAASTRYVLDRIAVVPASYEAGSYRF